MAQYGKEYIAEWNDESHFYEVPEMGWYSEDGDHWYNIEGEDLNEQDNPEFKNARIILSGGERDTEEVF